MLAEMRAKSVLARSLKAALRRNCHDCRAFAEKMRFEISAEYCRDS